MSRDASLYLEDIRESCRKIEAYSEGLTRETFEEEAKTAEAVAWNLVVVGEAVKQLPDELTEREPAIDWRKIAGFRDVLVHAYFGLDTDIVWDVVETKIGPLRAAVSRLLEAQG